MYKVYLILLLGGCMMSCLPQESTPKETFYEIDLVWQLDSIRTNKSPHTFISFSIYNNEDFALSNSNWELHYSDMQGDMNIMNGENELKVINVTGDYYKMLPQSNFPGIKVGETYVRSFALKDLVKRSGDAPVGFFMVHEGKAKPVRSSTIKGFDTEKFNDLNIPTPGKRFAENLWLTSLPKDQVPLIIPRPVSIRHGSGLTILDKEVNIVHSESLANEAELLAEYLRGQADIKISTGQEEGNILLKLDGENLVKEGYSLKTDADQVTITGGDNAGVFYGIQSLLKLLDPEDYPSDGQSLRFPIVEIDDHPRFAYRGAHLDVARNFRSIEEVKRFLDILAAYKLNKFHFHLTDDEGWRVEIEPLPELTALGGTRGYTTDERDKLYPAYGSGPDEKGTSGSGYYSRQEFIDLLQYANNRHIEVIPEIGFPGHARAAIKAMEARYHRLISEGSKEEAEQYLLSDLEDQSIYQSAQNYRDNVICVCREGAVNFMELVFAEVIEMFEEARVPINIFHTGGDEVPYGSWQRSPLCKTFIDSRPDLHTPEDLHPYFLEKMKAFLSAEGIQTGGWEEIVLKQTEAGHDGTVINEAAVDQNVIPYVWNAVNGWGREDMVYKLANLGFPVIMCNSASFYFDMAYDRGIDETGLSWSGYANTKKAFETEPLNIFKRINQDIDDNLLTPEYINSKVSLTTAGRKNFLGIQSQLWSETVIDQERFYYFIFPKILGFAERAWSPEPEWAKSRDPSLSERIFREDWNQFANILGQRELIRIEKTPGGQYFRIPSPGAIYEESVLRANISFPGLTIRYTEDGSEPDSTSKVFTIPVQTTSKLIRLKAFSHGGRGSKTSVVNTSAKPLKQ